MSRSGFFEGMVFGMCAGIVTGILFAPSSGEETRRRLKDMKDENEHIINNSKEKTEEMITKTLDAIEKGFSNITHMVDKKIPKPPKKG